MVILGSFGLCEVFIWAIENYFTLCYYWLFYTIGLVSIVDYSINGYWLLFEIKLPYIINGYWWHYFINGYWWLLMVIISVVIGGYWWLLVLVLL